MIDDALRDALDVIRAIRGLPGDAARARVAALAARHPALRLHLVPERDEYSGRMEYGLLVRAPDVETAYLTARAPSATPWLLHQVHDFREGVLLAVDGESLSVGDAIAALDEHLAHASLRERMVTTCILNRHLREHRYEVSDDELQAAVDEFRQRRGLHTAEATDRWMQATGTSHARLEQLAGTAVQVRKLRRDVCADRVEAELRAHADAFATAALIRIRVASAERARAARPDDLDRAGFLALAETMIAEELRGAAAGGVLDSVVVTRGELEPAFGDAVFAGAGRVVGPYATPDGVFLAYVSAIEPARELDARVRGLVERRCFDAWLDEQRAHASVEWNWGREE